MDTNLFLMQSFDSLFPIGAFTLSNGMETYVQKEIVCDRESLEKYLDSFLYVMPYNDLGFAAFVMRGGDFTLSDALCAGSKSPQELRDGSQKLCRRFIKAQKEILGGARGAISRAALPAEEACSLQGATSRGATPGAEADTPETEAACKLRGASPAEDAFCELFAYEKSFTRGECHGMYPVALGLYFRALCKTADEQKSALTFYAYSQITNLVNHAVKLVPLGQLEGQKALYSALQKLDAVVEKALNIKEDELGFGGCGFDFRSMQHETLYSRLYIS